MAKEYKSVLAAVLERITPREQPPAVKGFLEQLNKGLRTRKIKAVAKLGGSFAKNTWLKGDYDVDIFVAFDMKYKDERISDRLAKVVARFNPVRVHGSRDYFQVGNGFSFEIVPVLAIRSHKDAENITDFSLRHVGWVNARTKKLKGDIRLAKQFCKAQRVYGAESYIRGFSGHVVDLLVIKYNGFLPLLRAALKWKPKTVIDINKVHKGKALLRLNISKTQGPLVLVDPVQPERNAAASLTIENYNRFIHAARKFLARPSAKFFERQNPDFDKLAKKGKLVMVQAKPTDASNDVAGTRLMKLFEHRKSELVTSGFTVMNASWDWTLSSAVLWFVTKEKQLPLTRVVPGPPTKFEEHAKAFKRKYKKTFVRKGRIMASTPVTLRTPDAVIATAILDPVVKGKARNPKVKQWP